MAHVSKSTEHFVSVLYIGFQVCITQGEMHGGDKKGEELMSLSTGKL